MTLKELATIMNALWAQYPYQELDEDLRKLWYGGFGMLEKEVLAKAVRNWVMGSISEFPPKMGQIAIEVRRAIAPNIFLSFEEAKSKRTRLYKKAQRLVLGVEKKYNPLVSPDKLPTERDAIFHEKDIRRVYEIQCEQHQVMAVNELLDLRQELKLLNSEPSKRLETHNKQRELLKKVMKEPVPRRVGNDRIVAGCEDQRFIYQSEVIA